MSSKTNNWGAVLWLPRSLKEISAQADAIKAKQAKAPQRMRQLLARRGKAIAEKRTKDYLTTSNDNTQVKYSQAPLKQYNPHLTERGVQGAKSNAIWEKEHPNAAAWEYAASAIPFAVAAAPAVMAGSNALAGTALGRWGTQLLAKPAVQYINGALTTAMVGHGASEVAHGNFTPMTALELAPLGRLAKPMFNEAALAIENYRYPFGRPQVPENFLTIKPQVRTKVGDVEIGTPNMAYRQGNDLGRTYQKYKDVNASVAQHQIEDNIEQSLSSRNGRPYISREEALDKAIANGTFDPAIGIEVDGHSAAYQDTPMYSDGFLWYGTPKIDETLPLGSLRSGLLVTPRNDAFIIGSNKATPYGGTGSGILRSKSGVTTVTDNGGRLIPADADNLGLELNNISAYNWEPGYGYRKVFAEGTPAAEWPMGRIAPKITSENAASITPEITHFYHGSPVRFDAFSADFIGSGEGGSKVMRGINLWPEERIGNAPKLANIRSSDAPIHLGVPSTPLGGELNPTVYDVSGRGLKLYTASPREVKSLNQSDLISQGYDGIQTPNQVTVFPESISKLSIDKQSSIEDFVMSHPEVERWTPWTTDIQKMQNIIDRSKMSKWTPEQWTAAQDAAIARGDMTEAQRLRDMHFKVYAPDTAQQGIMYNASGNSIFNEFTGGRTGLNWFSESEKYAANHGVPRAFYINEPNIYFGNVPAWIKRTPVDERYIKSLRRLGYSEKQISQKVQSINEAVNSNAPAAKSIGMGVNNELVTKNNNTAKLADAVTYDNNGVRIPLGKRDNFNINDIRYGLLPFLGLGTAYNNIQE